MDANEASAEVAPDGQETGPAEPQATADAERVTYSMSPGLPGFLGGAPLALAVSSYQSGKFYLLGQNADGGLMVNERFFRKAMGICVPDRDTILLATLFQIVRFRNVLEPDQRINDLFDACYVPRTTSVTGELDAHDVGVLNDGRIVFVNTLYNCLATPSDRHSFAPLWKPPFISRIVKEDRCHLNGLAMADGVPRYVTAVSRSDTIDGWRDRRTDGGIVVDVASSEIVIGGLSMPHSPRIYRDRLWLLNSGTGELGWIEPGTSKGKGKFHAVAFCPGFLRGLAFHGKYAFVGLSKPRYQRFEGLALDRRLAEADSEPWCGIQVIDLESGACVHWFRLDGAVSELYDVAVVPGVTRPMTLGFASDEILGLITHDALADDASADRIVSRSGG
ncbi:TIGR03032 family protein [Bradyrhizobium aeschynomenes]|uniref:TIGR03032 family protein n=1 Tax=Bradyrhizobium aeschynomenes TaxID=2734909 RepID=UPI001AEDA9B3|nr:TIGR03032 family protein [Bradyrhizobium aeschynomenes]